MSNNYSMNLNLERLNKLNEKLNNVSAYPINFSKIQFLINRTMDLNDRLDEVINQSSSKFNIIKDNVSKKNF